MHLVDLLVPPSCVACSARGSLLCPRCRALIRPAFDERDRFVCTDAGVVIGEALSCAVALWAYDGPTRRALSALKYLGVRRLAPILAEMAAPGLARVLEISGPAALVPVPVHAERLAARGYNQAELIAREMAPRFGLEVSDALVRSQATVKQHRLNRGERLANLRGAFAARRNVPAVAILVDDIITTSATLEACAVALAGAGSRAVYGVALAREV